MQTFVIFFLAGLWVWLFVVEMKNLKNNAYSIQKLWMGEWRCQLYVHYMFWCNQKHWEYVVLCCKKKQIHIWYSCTFVENKTSTELQAEASMHEWEHCAGFPVVWHHFLFVGPILHSGGFKGITLYTNRGRALASHKRLFQKTSNSSLELLKNAAQFMI